MNPETFVQFGQVIEALISKGYRCQDAGSTKTSVWADFVGENWMSVRANWEEVVITNSTDPDQPRTVAIESIIGGKE